MGLLRHDPISTGRRWEEKQYQSTWLSCANRSRYLMAVTTVNVDKMSDNKVLGTPSHGV